MLERDEKESAGVEVRPEEEGHESGRGERPRAPQLFSELGTGITERAIEGPAADSNAPGDDANEAGEDGVERRRPLLTGRRKGGPMRRRGEEGPEARVEGVALSGEQRLLILDTWKRSGLTAGAFGRIAGVTAHTLYAWSRRFEALGPAGLDEKRRGSPVGSRMPEATKRAILMMKEQHEEW